MNRNLSRLCTLLLLGALAASTVIGCGWSFLNEHSVRFSGYSATSEFTRLPPLPVNPALEHKAETPARNSEMEYEAEYQAHEKRQAELDDLWSRAGDAEQRGDLNLSARLLRDFLRQSAEHESSWLDLSSPQSQRNSATDRLDALTALGQRARPAAVSAYLALRREYDLALSADQPAGLEALQPKLDEWKPPAALADNAGYLRAALLYQMGKTDEAARAFSSLASRYPRSEKREAALLMAGRAMLNQFERELQQAFNGRSEARESARATLQQCRREYPRGRFAHDARGWLARLSLLEGDRSSALAEYYRLLSESDNASSRKSLLVSLRLTRHHATEDEMRQVEARLADEPAAALTYAYHNLYNYAPVAGYYRLDCEGRYYDLEDRQREDFCRNAERDVKTHIVAFAANLLKRHPRTAASGGFALRLAQAQLEMEQHAAALQSAMQALRLGVNGRERVEGLWVKGSAELHLKELAAARRTLKQLVAEFPDSDLAEGAGRMIAMAAEDAGDLDGALEQYIALGYQDDIAYFLDVLMTPEQLAGFIARHPASPRLNELQYALAVRYLRANRLAEARNALAKVNVTETSYADRHYGWQEIDDPVEFRSHRQTAKTPSDAEGIAARWLWRDQKTIEDLTRLRAEADQAQGDEAKAEALYQLASYLYQSSSLLFYNPSLWDGARHYKLEEFVFGNGYRAPGEAQLLRQQMQQHEPVAQALDLYLEIAGRFPKTPAARDALYTAAVCHERLSDYNGYWRDAYGKGTYAGARLVSYADVRQAYPGYQLPRGTIGWEPVTRTVNSGPGWAAAPKPEPRPTRRMRINAKLAEFRQSLDEGLAWTREMARSIALGLAYSLLAIVLLLGSYVIGVGLYIRNQQPSHIALFEEARKPPEDSPVERLISDVRREITAEPAGDGESRP